MPTCPNGHGSSDEEYCEVCGRAMGGAPTPAAATPAARETDPVLEVPVVCPACGSPLDGRFCEECGHDSLATPPAGPVVPPAEQRPTQDVGSSVRTWTATVSADRDYFRSVMDIGGPDAGGIAFPAYCPDRYFPLRGNQNTIGRRSASRGIHPDIDLTGPPEDPGVSHLHAVLIVGPDGGLSIVDLGSSNGTTVNGGRTTLRPNVSQPLADGDRVHLGAWTTITVRAQ